MIWFLIAGCAFLAGVEAGLGAAIATAAGLVLFLFFLGTLRALIDMIRYREEYIRCVDAIKTEDDEWIDHVNLINHHFYVGRAFRCSSGRDGIDMGYYYSIKVRVREGGGGGGDFMPMMFS